MEQLAPTAAVRVGAACNFLAYWNPGPWPLLFCLPKLDTAAVQGPATGNKKHQELEVISLLHATQALAGELGLLAL